jgi:hypothetical protein
MSAGMIGIALLIGSLTFIAGKYLHRQFYAVLRRVHIAGAESHVSVGGLLYPRLDVSTDGLVISVSVIAGGGRKGRFRGAPSTYATARSPTFWSGFSTLTSAGYLSITERSVGTPGGDHTSGEFSELFSAWDEETRAGLTNRLSGAARVALVELTRRWGPTQLSTSGGGELTLSLRGIVREPAAIEDLVRTFRVVMASVAENSEGRSG